MFVEVNIMLKKKFFKVWLSRKIVIIFWLRNGIFGESVF